MTSKYRHIFYDPDGAMDGYRAALRGIASGGTCDIAVWAASEAAGVGTTKYDYSWPMRIRDALVTTRGYGCAADYYPATGGSTGVPTQWSNSTAAPFTFGTGASMKANVGWHRGVVSSDTGTNNILTFTVPNNGRYSGTVDLVIHYLDWQTGTATYKINGGTANNVVMSTTLNAFLMSSQIRKIDGTVNASLNSRSPGDTITFQNNGAANRWCVLGVTVIPHGVTSGIRFAQLTASGLAANELSTLKQPVCPSGGGTTGTSTGNMPGNSCSLLGGMQWGKDANGLTFQSGLPIPLQPSGTPTATSASGGSMVPGTYQYAQTNIGPGGIESLALTFSGTVASAQGTLNLASLPVDPGQGVTGNLAYCTWGRNLYRTTVGGTTAGPFYRLQSATGLIANNTATTYSDTLADSSITGFPQLASYLNPNVNGSYGPLIGTVVTNGGTSGVSGYGFPCSPDLLIIHLGENDMLNWDGSFAQQTATVTALSDAIDACRQAKPSCSVMFVIYPPFSLVNTYYPGWFKGQGTVYSNYVQMIEGLARIYAAEVYLSSVAGAGQSAASVLDRTYAHPNDSAQQTQANDMLEIL